MAETLYPMDLIKRTFRSICSGIEPTSIDQVIEFRDVTSTFLRLPAQYKRLLNYWDMYDGETSRIAMAMGEDESWVRVTRDAAWKYLYDLMNGDP